MERKLKIKVSPKVSKALSELLWGRNLESLQWQHATRLPLSIASFEVPKTMLHRFFDQGSWLIVFLRNNSFDSEVFLKEIDNIGLHVIFCTAQSNASSTENYWNTLYDLILEINNQLFLTLWAFVLRSDKRRFPDLFRFLILSSVKNSEVSH